MDLNRLYSRHQVCVFRAEQSTAGNRRSLMHEAARFADQIARVQHSLGAEAAQGWDRLTSNIDEHPQFGAGPD